MTIRKRPPHVLSVLHPVPCLSLVALLNLRKRFGIAGPCLTSWRPSPSVPRRQPRTEAQNRPRGPKESAAPESQGLCSRITTRLMKWGISSSTFRESGDSIPTTTAMPQKRKVNSPPMIRPAASTELRGAAFEAENEEEDRDDRQDHQEKIDGMDDEFIRLDLLTAHPADTF